MAEVREYLRGRRDALVAAGVALERICLDPGIGFGKTHAHNIELMANCFRFHELGCPLLVGHSRKGFLGKLLGDDQADRTNATVGAALALAVQGVQIVRVHDVRPVREALVAVRRQRRARQYIAGPSWSASGRQCAVNAFPARMAGLFGVPSSSNRRQPTLTQLPN